MTNLFNPPSLSFDAFRKDEDGAVTVDWVVLTAVIVGLALVIIPIIVPGLNSAASDMAADIVAAGTIF